jgi:CheY-like chemotaxis protein
MRTIFFAHDQQENPEVRKHFLELAGYVVKQLKSQRELVAAFKEGQPDLVLIDALLEGKNGFETALELHQRFPERDFPIVICSQIYRTRPFREEALRSGAQDYLLLPMPPDEFLRRVNQAIGYFVPPDSVKTAA